MSVAESAVTLRTRRFDDATPLIGDADALRAVADREGYLFFAQLLPAEPLQALRAEILAACSRRGWLAGGTAPMDGIIRPGVRLGAYDEPWIDLVREVYVLPEFQAVGRSPAVLGALRTLYGEAPATGRGDVCRITSPNAADLTTPPHQDHFFIGGSARVWTVWIPLGDCPPDLGGLAVLPASHRAGLLPHEGPREQCRGIAVGDEAVWATASYRCGDVLCFSALTVHRALPNVSADRARVSVDYRYAPASEC